jgi:hypothetical protein
MYLKTAQILLKQSPCLRNEEQGLKIVTTYTTKIHTPLPHETLG